MDYYNRKEVALKKIMSLLSKNESIPESDLVVEVRLATSLSEKGVLDLIELLLDSKRIKLKGKDLVMNIPDTHEL